MSGTKRLHDSVVEGNDDNDDRKKRRGKTPSVAENSTSTCDTVSSDAFPRTVPHDGTVHDDLDLSMTPFLLSSVDASCYGCTSASLPGQPTAMAPMPVHVPLAAIGADPQIQSGDLPL